MTHLSSMVWIETRKALRSRMPIFTLSGFLLIPLVATFFMVILKDLEFARRAGLISAKAELMAGSADWPTFLSILAQAVAVGGVLLFSLIGSWVFGREFVDGTMKDLLAVPVARTSIVLAKFIVVTLWSLALTVISYGIALLLGAVVGLPLGSALVIWQGTVTIAGTALLVVAVMTPVALFASIGRGYLLPVGTTLLFVLFANVLSVAGWGNRFPWAIPAIFAGAGDGSASIGWVAYGIVVATAISGVAASCAWWHFADQQ